MADKNYINCFQAYRYKTSGCMCGKKGHVHFEDCKKCKEWEPNFFYNEDGTKKEKRKIKNEKIILEYIC